MGVEPLTVSTTGSTGIAATPERGRGLRRRRLFIRVKEGRGGRKTKHAQHRANSTRQERK